MKTLEKVSDFVGKYMAAIVIVVAALALLFPGPFSVVKTRPHGSTPCWASLCSAWVLP